MRIQKHTMKVNPPKLAEKIKPRVHTNLDPNHKTNPVEN